MSHVFLLAMTRLICRTVGVSVGITLLTACYISNDPVTDFGYAAWSGTEPARDWTLAAELAVAETDLINQTPTDVKDFCPVYASLSSRDKKRFWAGLLSAMAKFESNFEPRTAFTETLRDSKGNNVVSRGLLQISLESANQARYGCGPLTAKTLHDPATNLSCGARILSKWVRDDGAISHAESPIAGGGRYWSVLRPSNQNLRKIKRLTLNFEFCVL
ncbi:MAG: transglycosylase SLT domain-containing protein [Pseudomonadota bacterium]